MINCTQFFFSFVKQCKQFIGSFCIFGEFFFEDFSGHILEDDTLARLISMPNVIVTSHQAFLTEEALSNIAETTVENIIELVENGKCENEILHKNA